MKQTVTLFDVNVDIRQRYKFVTIIISILKQFYPQTQLTYIYWLRIKVHAEETMTDDCNFLVEERFLNAGQIIHAFLIREMLIATFYFQFVILTNTDVICICQRLVIFI